MNSSTTAVKGCSGKAFQWRGPKWGWTRGTPHGQWGNTGKTTTGTVHLISGVDNVLYDTVLSGKRKKSLRSLAVPSCTLPQQNKSEKQMQKKWRKKIQAAFLSALYNLSKMSEQVAWMKLIISFDQRTLLYCLFIYFCICAHPEPAIG